MYPPIPAPARDRRFADDAWAGNPLFFGLQQSYLLTARLARELVAAAELDPRWRRAEIVARDVESGVPRMPLSDSQLMRGAYGRAEAVLRMVRQSSRLAVRDRRRLSRVLVRWLILVCSWRSRWRSMASA